MTMALKRRALVERKTLALVRGKNSVLPASGPILLGRPQEGRPAPAQTWRFAGLRRIAIRQGLSIVGPSAPKLGTDELLLLASLAAAQRTDSPDPGRGQDPRLRAAVLRCARLLHDMGLRLSTAATCGTRTRDTIDLRGRAA